MAAVEMLSSMADAAAVRIARTTDAAMTAQESLLIQSSAVALLSRPRTVKRVAESTPVLVLAGGMIMWASRVAQLRQLTSPRYAEPTFSPPPAPQVEIPDYDYDPEANGFGPQGEADAMPDTSPILSAMQELMIS